MVWCIMRNSTGGLVAAGGGHHNSLESACSLITLYKKGEPLSE